MKRNALLLDSHEHTIVKPRQVWKETHKRCSHKIYYQQHMPRPARTWKPHNVKRLQNFKLTTTATTNHTKRWALPRWWLSRPCLGDRYLERSKYGQTDKVMSSHSLGTSHDHNRSHDDAKKDKSIHWLEPLWTVAWWFACQRVQNFFYYRAGRLVSWFSNQTRSPVMSPFLL